MQREKETRPKSQYDLGLRPKLKESERLKKSLSLPQIQTVRPVESAGSGEVVSIEVKAFESPKVPIKSKPYVKSNVNDYGEHTKCNGTQIIAIIKFMLNSHLAIHQRRCRR